ncbi:hypothetical protein IMCC20628_00907 [Hoeflea sp. IMCC20628]|nr:hypothetical protein IMCC20628_00907 [Hoeflea sp. IMCC20628]
MVLKVHKFSIAGQCEFSRFIGTVLTAVVVCGSLLLAGCSDERSPRALSKSEIEQCKRITKPEIIDVAIRDVAEDIPNLFRELNSLQSGGVVSEEAIPSASEAFQSLKNSNCCKIRDKIPGDYDRDTQKLGVMKDGFIRIYAVEANYEIDPSFKHNKRRTIVLVNCTGKTVGGPSFSIR